MRFKAAFGVFLLCCCAAFAQPSESRLWYQTPGSAGAVSSTFENLVFTYLSVAKSPFRSEKIDLADLRNHLQQIRATEPPPEIVIHLSMNEYLQILNDPEWKEILRAMNLSFMNARLFSYPFYLLKDRNAPVSGNHVLPIAWITVPDSFVHPVEDADVLTMLSEALGVPKSSLKIVRERGAYPAAKKMFEGEYRLIGIYEDDPSALLDEFRVNWQEELKAGGVEFFPYDEKRITPQLVPVVPGRFGYAFFTYRDRPFEDEVPEGSAVLAVTQQDDHPFPVLLSNAGTKPGSQLARALSFAYFLMPSTPAVKAAAPLTRRRIEQMYLLNSYLEDPDSRYKSLGLLGSLLLNQEDAVEKPKRELYAEKCDVFQRKLKLPETSASEILKWLGIEQPALRKRALFTSDVSRLYEEALEQIDSALGRSGQDRIRSLEKARAGLVAALLQGNRPRAVQGSRGLWSVSNYNPYYQLARVSLYLELEKQTR